MHLIQAAEIWPTIETKNPIETLIWYMRRLGNCINCLLQRTEMHMQWQGDVNLMLNRRGMRTLTFNITRKHVTQRRCLWPYSFIPMCFVMQEPLNFKPKLEHIECLFLWQGEWSKLEMSICSKSHDTFRLRFSESQRRRSTVICIYLLMHDNP